MSDFDDIHEHHGITADVVARWAPQVGRIALNHSLVDSAVDGVFVRLPAPYRDPDRDPHRIPLTDRLREIKRAAKGLPEMSEYRDRLLIAASLTRKHALVRDVVCHWSMAAFDNGKDRILFVQWSQREGTVEEFDLKERWYTFEQVREAVGYGINAADTIYDVLFELEGLPRPSTASDRPELSGDLR